MKIAIRFLGLPPSEALRQHSERQAVLQLGRFENELESIEIRIRDVNGPRGGDDMECKVSARGPRIGFSTVAEVTSDAYGSVCTAMSRMSRSVARSLDRARGMRGLTPAPQLAG